MEDRSTRCAHCGRPFEATDGVGRPRKYCRRSCRQRAFEIRRHQEDQAWSDARLIRAARELATLEDRLDEIVQVVRELRAEVDDDPDADAAEILERLERGITL